MTDPRYCELCNVELYMTHDGPRCVACDERAETERAPQPDGYVPMDHHDETTNPGFDPIDDIAHQRIVARLEQGFDARWKDREKSLVRTLSDAMAAAISEAVAPLHRRLDALEGALRLIHAAVERAAEHAIDVATMRDQVRTLLGRCADEHGPFGSVPPQHGNGASLPPAER